MSFHSQIFKLFLILSFIKVYSEDKPIKIELSTKQEIMGLHVSNAITLDSPLKSSYLNQLRNVLCFDLNNCGYSKVIEMTKTQENALTHTDLRNAFNLDTWKQSIAKAVLKVEIVKSALSLYVFDVKTANLKKFEGIPLTGNLSQDKMQIHRLSGALIKALFGVESITTDRVLYSVQKEGENLDSTGWKSEIWECDYDGSSPRQVTFEDSYSITPIFIPHHPIHGKDRYLYVSYKTGQPKIYFSDLENKSGKPLIKLRGNQLLPSISSDRSKLAFICDATGRADLFLQNIDSNGNLLEKPKQLFSYPRSTQASPTFSPDGSYIAFVSDKDGTPRIYIIPTDLEKNRRATPKLITKLNRENTCPSWSPDGTKLAYSSRTDGVRQIWIYDVELGKEIQLTEGAGNKENPVWASNSLHLIFNSTDPNHSELYLVNLNQPEPVRLTNGPGKKHYPTWGKR